MTHKNMSIEEGQRDMSIEQDDAVIAKITTHPRVTFDDLKANIIETYYVSGYDLIRVASPPNGGCLPDPLTHPACLMTLCVIVLKNGYTVLGHSAVASPENFNVEIGRKIAYDAAIRQAWPLMGYALKQQLHELNTEHDGR